MMEDYSVKCPLEDKGVFLLDQVVGVRRKGAKGNDPLPRLKMRIFILLQGQV